MSTRAVFLAGYLVVGLALLGLAVLSHRRSSAVATVSEMTASATRRRVGRLLVLLVWWWVGFHVLARSA